MQAPALICFLRGPDHVFELVNPLYQLLFPGRMLIGAPIREALPELQGTFFEMLDRVFTTGDSASGNEIPVDERFFNFVYQPTHDADTIDGVMVFGFEVTGQVQARREAAILAEELQRANREKDEFIAVVAHELRTPMTSILGWVRLLQLGDLDAETQASALEALKRSTKAQAKIIEDLLDDSRIASGKLRLEVRPLNLVTIAEAAVEMMRPAAEARQVALDLQLADEPLQVVGDPNRLQQVIANVLSNAIKFSPEGSHIAVRVSRSSAFADIEVRDHGRGIAPELLPHVFERFRQGGMAEKQGAGLGLGLAIARHLIELQGGSITATSDGEGKGALFVVRLPLRVDAAVETFVDREHAERATALPSLSGVHALIVEDDIDNRDVIAAVMARCGATVDLSSTAADAMLHIGRRKPDVIIADIVLPDVDGCAFMAQLRADGAKTPALALTVFGRPKEQERIIAAGYNVLRQKPIEPADLANEVARLVGR